MTDPSLAAMSRPEMLAHAEAYGLTFAVPAADTAVGAALRAFGEFARPEVDFLLASAQAETGSFVDVGANLGAIALPFAAARPAWKVLAIEPQAALGELLSSNVARNQLANVTVLRAAAGAQEARVEYPNPSLALTGNYGDIGFHTRPEIARAPTDMVVLDAVAPEDTRVVKIDVQGFEPDVLRGARRLLAEVRPVWLVEASTNRDISAEVVRIFQAADYRLFWFYSPFVTAKPARGGPPANSGTGDANFVAVPRGADPVWPLQPVTSAEETRPGTTSAYPYLQSYGY